MVGMEAGGIHMVRGAFVRVPRLVKAQRGRLHQTVEGKEEASVAGVEESSWSSGITRLDLLRVSV